MTRRVTWLGHSTVLIELGGARILTDPVLRERMLHLRRVGGPVDRAHHDELDAVLISHVHHDHLDLPSLRLLDREHTRLVVPVGAGRLAAKEGFAALTELAPGGTTEIDGAHVRAVPAVHGGSRGPLGVKAETLGFVVEGDGLRVYFAGDTDLFDEMAELGALDLALIPVWGWGPKLGAGHLDPERAAEAIALIEPRIAIPIHWGTFFPRFHRDRARRLIEPPREFASAAARVAPTVDVRVLAPGDALDL